MKSGSTGWTLHTALDYMGIAYYLESGANLTGNRFWLMDRQKEWRALPEKMQEELQQTLQFVQVEQRVWREAILIEHANQSAEFGKGVWITRNVTRPPSKKWGHFTNQDAWTAEVVLGKYIGISGEYSNHVDGPQKFNRRFRIGDEVEYDSYNLKYTGKITAIGKTTVTITDRQETRRLSLYDFIWRNWNFDAKMAAEHNAEEMLHL